MDDQIQAKSQDIFPLLISPVRSLYDGVRNTSLSKVFARTKMDAFLPENGENIVVFHYGLKNEFEKIFAEDIDRNEKIDNNNLITQITTAVKCELESIESANLSESCQKSE